MNCKRKHKLKCSNCIGILARYSKKVKKEMIASPPMENGGENKSS
jgi:hypothetical protein